MKTIIKDTVDFTVIHHTGITRFTGCQCIKDCSCHEDFTPAPYDYYSVKKKFGKYKTTTHATMSDVEERIKVLLDIPNKRYHDKS
jgi:hypothetical protein